MGRSVTKYIYSQRKWLVLNAERVKLCQTIQWIRGDYVANYLVFYVSREQVIYFEVSFMFIYERVVYVRHIPITKGQMGR